MRKGYVHIYTGDGKGKTTAAVGLAVRAAGAGLKVFFLQFLKGKESSELKIFRKIGKKIKTAHCGGPSLIMGKPSAADRKMAAEGFSAAREAILSGKFDLVILDEAVVALSLKLIDENKLVGVLKERPAGVEIVMTGRGASKKLLAAVDLVTEMREVKHYYSKGVRARKGIEL